MSRILAVLVITFTLISVVEGAIRRSVRYSRYTRYTYVGGGYIAGYAFGGIIGMIILLLLIYFCIKHINSKKQRVSQRPVVFHTGATSTARPFQGSVPQPPPYAGPPPVYSTGPLYPNHKTAGAPPPYPNPQLRHRSTDPFYTPGSAFPPPLQQYPPQPQPQPQPPQPQDRLPPLSTNPQGVGDSVSQPPPYSQANTPQMSQDAAFPPLHPSPGAASAPPADV